MTRSVDERRDGAPPATTDTDIAGLIERLRKAGAGDGTATSRFNLFNEAAAALLSERTRADARVAEARDKLKPVVAQIEDRRASLGPGDFMTPPAAFYLKDLEIVCDVYRALASTPAQGETE